MLFVLRKCCARTFRNNLQPDETAHTIVFLFNAPSLALLVYITSTCLNVEAVTRTEELWSKSLFDMLYKTLLVCKSDVLCIPPLLVFGSKPSHVTLYF